MEDNMKTKNKILAEFCEHLEKNNVTYELNEKDENMLRFRTKLPDHDATPYVLVHINPKNDGLSLALSRIAMFPDAGPEVYRGINKFNSDPSNFGCKMFIDDEGQIVVLTNAIIKGEEPVKQIEDYLNINILALNKYYGRISEKIDNSNKD